MSLFDTRIRGTKSWLEAFELWTMEAVHSFQGSMVGKDGMTRQTDTSLIAKKKMSRLTSHKSLGLPNQIMLLVLMLH